MRIHSAIQWFFKLFMLGFCCTIFSQEPVVTKTLVVPTATQVPPKSNPTDFPSALPVPSHSLHSNVLESHTPDYVVIHASDQVTFSSEIIANVEQIYVKEGSRFKTGDILLKLDCRLQKAELDKAKAQQLSSKHAYRAAKKLKTYGLISDYELTKAISDVQVANAEVVKLATIAEKCMIIAPFNGSVAEVMVHAHESVKQGDPLLKIVNLENLQFELLVPSCWLKWLHAGSEFNVTINETGQTLSAKITEINPQIEPVSQSVRLIATITPSNPHLLPGMSGQAKFPENLTPHCSQGEK